MQASNTESQTRFRWQRVFIDSRSDAQNIDDSLVQNKINISKKYSFDADTQTKIMMEACPA